MNVSVSIFKVIRVPQAINSMALEQKDMFKQAFLIQT